MVQILYFAWVRERIGMDGETVDVPPHVTDVGALLDLLAARSDAHAAALADRGAIKVALDQDFAGPDSMIAGAREIAIFPPVTGG